MKQKYTITVANSEINIITEEPKESIDTVVGVVDRRLREILLHSKSISRVDAALLLSLECAAEKINIQKQLRDAEAQNERLVVLGESKDREIALLEREIETLRASLNIANSHGKNAPKRANSAQLGFDDIDGEHTEASAEEPVKVQKKSEEPAESTLDTAVQSILDGEEHQGEHGRKRRRVRAKSAGGEKPSKVRSMFDLISYDDI
ncbi:MAG: cell division protein ZapA [Eubacteriales bacterium]